MDDEQDIRTLQFREQSDGRRVASLNGKIVLVNVDERDRVEDGEWWLVRLDHKETFAIAHLLEKRDAPAEPAEVRVPVRPRNGRASPDGHHPHDLDVAVRSEDRIALFVDGANMDFASRKAGFFIDWARVRDHFTSRGAFYAAYFYIATFPEEDASRIGWLDFLSHSGYVVRTRMVKRVTDEETGETYQKANLDIDLAVDMLATAPNWDVAFLFSGNGDFRRVVDQARALGKRVYVVSGRTSLARELAWAADKPVIHVDAIREDIEREDRQVEETRVAD